MTESQARDLLIRFRRHGDPDDFAAFYDATCPTLLTRARRLAPDDAGADDLLQATYVAAMTSVERFDRRRDAVAWLVGILHNQARIMRWRRRRRPDAERLPWPEPVDPAELAEDRELHETVDRAITELGPVYQPVMILHLQHGLSAAEIGVALDRPAGTVRTQIVRGMALLRAALPASLASALLVQVVPASGGGALRGVLRDLAAEARAAPASVVATAASVAVSSTALVGAGLAVMATAAVLVWLPIGGAADAAPVATHERETSGAAVGSREEAASVLPQPRRARIEALPARVEQDPKPAAKLVFEELFGGDGPESGAGGAYGGRSGGRERLARSYVAAGDAIGNGLDWLARHQSPDGRWDADGFMALDDPKLGPATDARGAAGDDVLTTALASLAFLHDGKHGRGTEYEGVVSRGVFWLLQQQNAESGAIGSTTAARGLMHHAMATLALLECYGLTQNMRLQTFARRAVEHLEQRRAGEGYWTMYEAGEDRSAELTVWVVYALHAARSFRLETQTYAALADGLAALPASTPRSTAARLVAHFFASLRIDDVARADAEALGKLDANLRAPDYETWFLIGRGLYQVGGRSWQPFRGYMDGLIEIQRQEGNFAGSWDPSGAPGTRGGRIASTAWATLCLETYDAHSRLFVR